MYVHVYVFNIMRCYIKAGDVAGGICYLRYVLSDKCIFISDIYMACDVYRAGQTNGRQVCEAGVRPIICMCVCVCVRACVRACVCVCVCVLK
jgi:hypothetical protein